MAKLRVLIVDDDPTVRRVLARTFEQAGFQVDLAPNGEKAVSLLAGDRFDVMISDIQMPRMDGRELCHHLATEGPYLPDCTLIITSRSEHELRSWVEQYPGVSIVEKPVGPRQLLRLVKQRVGAGAAAE